MKLWLATEDDKPALAFAFTSYMAELSPDADPAEDQPYFDLYWREPSDRFPYLFGHDTPQGFAFVRKPEEDDLDFEMAEFCVFPAHRRGGIGLSIFEMLLQRHPGQWEVSVLLSNRAGLSFWPMALRGAFVQDLGMRDGPVARDYRFTAP